MCRRARYSLVALIVCGMLVSIYAPHLTQRAAAQTTRYRIFLPGVIVQPPMWSAPELAAFDLINQQRRAHGCPPVALNEQLGVAAQAHSKDMADNNYFSHTGRNGSTFSDRARAAGYPYRPSGEIIAAGYSSAADVVAGWMNSPGHRGIILTCANDDIGIGLRENPNSTYRFYWTAVFGQR